MHTGTNDSFSFHSQTMSQVPTISLKYAYLCRSNFPDFRLQQPSLVHGDKKLYKAFSDGNPRPSGQ